MCRIGGPAKENGIFSLKFLLVVGLCLAQSEPKTIGLQLWMRLKSVGQVLTFVESAPLAAEAKNAHF